MIIGSLVALVTPMLSAGEIDWQRLHDLVDFHLDNGTDAIVVIGTTGESATLAVKERCQVIRDVVAQVRGRIPVIAGTGANSTQKTIYLTAEAKALGADACLLVTPCYDETTQEGLFQHFREVAESVAIPQILYNVPSRTAVDMLPDTVKRLSDLAHIVAIKEATGNLDRAREIIERCGDRIDVLSGDDITAVELMLMGGKGNISVTANVVPAAMHQLCSLAIAGKRDEARAIHQRLLPLHRALFLEANPIPVKWALQSMNLIGASIRLPLTPLSEQYHTAITQALNVAGVKLSKEAVCTM
ncbi:MAG: 4-hydroxy-tetrahydrodipicolinate synthase [Endozoicomonadaceae bacterium]|nr:4-hydroxy-tetrahydrodipicolinate synthase [Endozoicomonadaceae bacterium]